MRYNIDRIISEEINKYLYKDSLLKENSYFEQEKTKKESDTTKDSESSDGDFDSGNYFSTSKGDGTEQFADHLADLNQDGQLNIRKLASRMSGISTSTKSKSDVNKLNALQSKLRKKIYGEKAPSGDNYGLTNKDVAKISNELSM